MWKVNEIREIDGKRIKCVKDPIGTCDGCVFIGRECEDSYCMRFAREDHQDVKYVEVEEDVDSKG